MDLKTSTFLVTGGASGLGEGTVRTLHAGGANVVIADVNRDRGEALAGELGERARFALTDVTDEQSVRGAVRLAEEVFGGLRGGIQCAGVALAERVLGKAGPHPLEAFAKVITVNLIGTFNVNRLTAEAINRAEPLPSGERG